MRLFGVAGAAAALFPERVFAERVEQAKVVLGDGVHKYEWIAGWAKSSRHEVRGQHARQRPGRREDRVYFNTDTENAVMIFEQDGTRVKSRVQGRLARHEDREGRGQGSLWLCHLGRRGRKCTPTARCR
jgi:hypothetical protein